MPNRWPIASGNWSNAAIWSGSIIPTASDDVFANNQTVTIDTDISVSSLRNSATGSAVARGSYVINNGVTITAPTIISSTGSMLTISQSNAATIRGNLTTAATLNAICLTMSATSSLTITGSISAGNASNTRGIVNTSSGTLIITGSLTSVGASSTGYSLYKQTLAGTVIITGSIFSDTATVIRNEQNSTSYYVLGDLIGGSNACFQDSAGGAARLTLYVIGNIYGTTGGTVATIYITGNPVFVSVSGSLIASTNEAVFIADGTAVVNGAISASRIVGGISTNSGTVIATGPFYNTNNRNAVFAQNLQLISGSTPTWTFDTETALEQRTLYTQNFPGNFPATNNVRQGVTFGDTGQFTGTIAMPNASDVFKGVPINNTTGSASFDTQSVWSVATSSLTASNSVGARLSNTATVATDANLITSKGTI